MSDQNQEITETMKRLLRDVRKHAFSPKEKTFFSVEGIIGRLEDPTSDLLRFFMSPDECHDLGPLFLRAFFACLKKDCSALRFEDVTAAARVQTFDRNFIDLLIPGWDWVLVIENKIDAQNRNPLTSYEEHAKRYFRRRDTHLAILSPDGRTDPEFPKWKAVSYQDYCNALKSEFAKTVFDRPISKWQVFAREFILHLENKLYNPAMTMTLEQTAFVEANLREIGELKKLSGAYTEDLRRELSERVQLAFPGIQFPFYDSGDWLKSPITVIGELRLEFGFWTPAHESGNPERKFVIAAWVKGLTEAQRQRATDLFARGAEQEDGGYWLGERRLDTRREAVDALCDLAKELLELWGNEPPALPPAEAAA